MNIIFTIFQTYEFKLVKCVEIVILNVKNFHRDLKALL